MNLTDYFDDTQITPINRGLSKELSVYGKLLMPGDKRMKIGKDSLAIIGVNESRNSNNPGAANAPDAIRKYLYALSGSIIPNQLVDLGNLKHTPTPSDTYIALRDVVSHVSSLGATCLILGGTQELTHPIFQGISEHEGRLTLSIIDQTIDMSSEDDDFSSTCYINRFLKETVKKVLALNMIGYQGYFTNGHFTKTLLENNGDLIRLGMARSAMSEVEPLLRDSCLISLDMACIRQGDSPGTINPSPNGFYAEEICQLARYAGMSSKIKAFGIFELDTQSDLHGQSSHLAAQVAWHFVEAFYSSIKQRITPENQNFKRFFVKSPIPKIEMVFLKSEENDLWWMELPGNKSSNGKPIVIACSYNDYLMASKGEIPERWVNISRRVR